MKGGRFEEVLNLEEDMKQHGIPVKGQVRASLTPVFCEGVLYAECAHGGMRGRLTSCCVV
jgi:hypothetical protein